MSQSNCELLRIPIKQINFDSSENFNTIKSLNLYYLYSEDNEYLNAIPITVVLDKNRNYQLVKGYETFNALIKAGKEWAIALCISEEAKSNHNWKYELGLENSKLNICTIGSKEFKEAFEYIHSNDKNFSNINVKKLVKAFSNDKARIFWSNLDILLESRSGITKSKSLLLEKYFYASPDFSQLSPISSIDINHATEDEIYSQIERMKIEPKAVKLRKIDSLLIARAIASNEDRIYWSSGQHLIKARLGITPSIWPLIEKGFCFIPEQTPFPNTSKFLLSQLNIDQLREEAKSRNINITGSQKNNFIEALSQKC
tara:strand:- start:23325 stop:24266 length:942 start_codon:yes stop_codon:yes gene_type:complete